LRQIDRELLVSRALYAARKAAGFETAASVAAHFGWTLGRYRSHESGARRIPTEDLIRYAKAFRVSADRLRNPDPRAIEEWLEQVREKAEAARLDVARRLKAARILRGYRSGVQAAQALGVAVPTYIKHEAGENGLSPDTAAFYASMLRVSKVWLQTGRAPSGLGEALDATIRRVLSHPENFVGRANNPNLPPPMEDVVALKPGRPAQKAISIPEYLWSELESARGIEAAKPSGLISIPAVATAESFAPSHVVSVLSDLPKTLRQFSRTFVDLAGGLTEYGDYLIWGGSELRIQRLTLDEASKLGRELIVGRVVGTLGPLDSQTNEAEFDR
jgi:hypothetical protein